MSVRAAFASIGLLLGAVAFGPGTAGARAGSPNHTAKRADRSHPAVKALHQALHAGEAFRMSFACLPEGITPGQRRAVARALRQVRATLPDDARYEFLTGLELALAPTKEKTVTVEHPVGDEDAKHPSAFRLSSTPPHQAYVVFRTAGEGERTWHVHALMLPTGEGWRSGGLTAFLARYKQWDAEAALGAARKESAAGHKVVALALFGLANELGKTPRYRTSGFHQRLRTAFEPLSKALGQPEDRPVEVLQTPSGKLAVHYVNARVYSRGAYLLIFRTVAKLERQAAMEARQRQLAAAFLKAHPELKQYFVGIGVSEAPDPPIGVAVRTLYPNEELEASPAEKQ